MSGDPGFKVGDRVTHGQGASGWTGVVVAIADANRVDVKIPRMGTMRFLKCDLQHARSAENQEGENS
jgi:hypothetical protein